MGDDMKRITAVALLSAIFLAGLAHAIPPYDITVTFAQPSSGPLPDSYNLYIDDCTVSGPTAPAYGTVIPSQQFVGALPAAASYQICVRTVNAAGENPDPGPVATVDVSDLPLSDPIENLNITVQCPLGSCTVNVSVE